MLLDAVPLLHIPAQQIPVHPHLCEQDSKSIAYLCRAQPENTETFAHDCPTWPEAVLSASHQSPTSVSRWRPEAKVVVARQFAGNPDPSAAQTLSARLDSRFFLSRRT